MEFRNPFKTVGLGTALIVGGVAAAAIATSVLIGTRITAKAPPVPASIASTKTPSVGAVKSATSSPAAGAAALAQGVGANPFGALKNNTGGEPAPILNGSSDPEEARHYEVSIFARKANSQVMSQCSGIVIAPQVILTAAHCLADICPVSATDSSGRVSSQRCVPELRPKDSFIITNTQGSINLKGSSKHIHDLVVHHKYSNPAYIHDSDNDVGLIFTTVPVYSTTSTIGWFVLKTVSDERKYAKLDDLAKNTQAYKARIAGYGASTLTNGGDGTFKHASVTTAAMEPDFGEFFIDNYSYYSRRNYGISGYSFQDSFIRYIPSMLSVTAGGTPALFFGDSGGGISHSDYPNRYFGINSATSLNNSVMRSALLKPVYEFFAPIGQNRSWIESSMVSEGRYMTPKPVDLTDGNCYPNWPDTKPRNKLSKRCDTRTSDTQEQSDKNTGNAFADGSAGFNPNSPLSQCSAADLKKLVDWNYENSSAGLAEQWRTNQRRGGGVNSQILNRANYIYNDRVNRRSGSNPADAWLKTQGLESLKASSLDVALSELGVSNNRTALNLEDCIGGLVARWLSDPLEHMYDGASCITKYLRWRISILLSAKGRVTDQEALRFQSEELRGCNFNASANQLADISRSLNNLALNFSAMINGLMLDIGKLKIWADINFGIGSDFNFNGDISYNAGGNRDNATLRMMNTMPGMRYGDGSQAYSVEWFTNGSTSYVNCIVPANIIAAGSSAIGTFAAINCRP